MKNVLKIGVIALVAGCIAFSSCKKDSKSASDILQTGSWKISKSEGKLTTETTWVAEPIDACDQDNFTTFTSATAYTEDAGATKCDPSDDQTSTGTYTLSSDGKLMSVDGLAFVSDISASKIVLTVTNVLGFGDDIRITWVPK